MIEIEKPTIECLEMTEDNTYGKFVAGPLQRGFGNTLGNSLTRIDYKRNLACIKKNDLYSISKITINRSGFVKNYYTPLSSKP